MDLSVVVVNWNGGKIIENCLNSVFPVVKNIDSEVILIDNGSGDGSLELIEKKFPKVRLIKNKDNLFFAKANNQGISAARGKWVMILGSDTIIQNNAVRKLFELAKRNRREDIIFAPQLISKNGGILLSCRKIPGYWNMFKYFIYMILIKKINPRSVFWGEYRMVDWNHDSERFVEQPEATCLLVRKSFCEKLGKLFDEDFPLYFNDVDLAVRVRNIGGKFFFYPDARIVHLGGQSTEKWNDKRLWLFRDGLLRFARKNNCKYFWDYGFLTVLRVVTYFWVLLKNFNKGSRGVYNISELGERRTPS